VSIDHLLPPDTELVVQSAEAVAAVVNELRVHQPSWEALGPDGRAVWLRKLRNWLLDNESRLVDIVTTETGKPRVEAAFEVMVTCDVINYYATGPEVPGRKEVTPARPAHRQQETHQGVPPVPCRRSDHAVELPVTHPRCRRRDGTAGRGGRRRQALGGHSAVRVRTRPRLGTDRCTAGVSVCHRPGRNGAAVVDSVDMVQFTGSTRTGRAIAVRAGERLIPAASNWGQGPGHRPADADLSRAANGIAWGALFNSGQACISVERVYVEAPAYARFVALLTERVLSIRQGADNGSYSTDVGGLVTTQQLEIVKSHVQDAVAHGATIATGGETTSEFFEPTILLDVDHSMACMRDETFGRRSR